MRRQISIRMYTFFAHSSLIQTILSAPEFHRILLESSRAVTADWELHPTPKKCYVVFKKKARSSQLAERGSIYGSSNKP